MCVSSVVLHQALSCYEIRKATQPFTQQKLRAFFQRISPPCTHQCTAPSWLRPLQCISGLGRMCVSVGYPVYQLWTVAPRICSFPRRNIGQQSKPSLTVKHQPDSFPYLCFETLINSLAPHLVFLYNYFPEDSPIPEDMAHPNIIMIPKKGKESLDPSSYCPIALLNSDLKNLFMSDGDQTQLLLNQVSLPRTRWDS